MTESTAVLLVDAYTSSCSRCGHGAFTQDTRHHRIATGWETPDPRDQPCGALFVAISTTRLEYKEDRLREIRPDLPAYEAGKAPRDLTT